MGIETLCEQLIPIPTSRRPEKRRLFSSSSALVAVNIRLSVLLFAINTPAHADRALNVWLVPVEGAIPYSNEGLAVRLDKFNSELARTRVSVVNTTDPVLKMQLMVWNPEFAVPNADWVLGQLQTLRALQRFGDRQGVNIRVRFITWDDAFRLINELDPAARSPGYPDVVEIASSWAAYFATKGHLASRPYGGGNWRRVLNVPASALPFTVDAQLLFYSKRVPFENPDSSELTLDTSSWGSLIRSFSEHTSRSDVIALPTGLAGGLLHDYASLVLAGGAEFARRRWYGDAVDLTSKEALAVPLLLQRMALQLPTQGQPRRLIAFPESSHEEVSRMFVNGVYRAMLQPATFMPRWRDDFRRQPRGSTFWDFAAADVPPNTYRRDTELVVFRGTSEPEASFSLAEFLSGDSDFTRLLAEMGQLPAGRPGYGTDVLARSLAEGGLSDPSVDRFLRAVQQSIDRGTTEPQVRSWPLAVESIQVMEALQLVWRRMAEGDPTALRRAASNTEWLINTRISWRYTSLDNIGQASINAELFKKAIRISLSIVVRTVSRRCAAVVPGMGSKPTKKHKPACMKF